MSCKYSSFRLSVSLHRVINIVFVFGLCASIPKTSPSGTVFRFFGRRNPPPRTWEIIRDFERTLKTSAHSRNFSVSQQWTRSISSVCFHIFHFFYRYYFEKSFELFRFQPKQTSGPRQSHPARTQRWQLCPQPKQTNRMHSAILTSPNGFAADVAP